MWNCFSSLHSSLGEQLLFSLFPTVTEMLRASKMVYKNNPADFFQACRMELCRTFCMSLKSLSPFCSWGDALTVPTVIFWLPHRFWMCWERTRGDLWFLPNNTQEVLPVHRFWGLIYFLLFRGFCLRLCFALGIRSVAQRCHLILGTLSRVQKGMVMRLLVTVAARAVLEFWGPGVGVVGGVGVPQTVLGGASSRALRCGVGFWDTDFLRPWDVTWGHLKHESECRVSREKKS